MEVRPYNIWIQHGKNHVFTIVNRTQQGLLKALLSDCKLFSRSSNELLSFEATCNDA